jgi:hypothetical protein
MDAFEFEIDPINEQEMRDRAMENGYKVLARVISIDDLLFTSGIIDLVYLPFDFYQLLTPDEFTEVITGEMVKHFEKLDEFEKCKFLKELDYSAYCSLFNEFYGKI